MPNSGIQDRAALRTARALLCVTVFAGGVSASFDAAAGLLDKLLAPAVGTKPGYSEGKKTYDEDTLKPDELQKCIVMAHDFDERAAHKPGDMDELAKQRDALNAQGMELKAAAEASAKDPLPPEQAEKLKARIAEYQKTAEEFNTKKDAALLNAKAYSKAQNELLTQYQDLCAGKRFWKSDVATVRPQLPFDISDILAGKK